MSAAQRGPRGLPSVDRVLRTAALKGLIRDHDRDAVVRRVRAILESHRAQLSGSDFAPTAEDIAVQVSDSISERWRTAPRPVINATGVILHTNLGRAPLGKAAIDAVVSAAGYVDLEFEVSSGSRGSRSGQTERLLQDLTGAQAGLVTTNNAAAVALALASVAAGREVLVSRGHAVEIGGGFRIPEILRQSRARLVDVGTTNRTRLSDFAAALTPKTAAILHVHASNFQVTGFTDQPAMPDLAELAHRHGVLLLADNGSGALLDTARFGVRHEPTPVEALGAGADLVAFSGDKLLGGPQAGILIGRLNLVAAAARHPLVRAVRADKLTLAALNSTLSTYLDGSAVATLPVWQMIAAPAGSVRERAEEWRARAAGHGIRANLETGESTIGGGSLPGETLPTTLIELPVTIRASALRRQPVPIIARTIRRRVYLDLRTVLPDQDASLLAGILAAQSGH